MSGEGEACDLAIAIMGAVASRHTMYDVIRDVIFRDFCTVWRIRVLFRLERRFCVALLGIYAGTPCVPVCLYQTYRRARHAACLDSYCGLKPWYVVSRLSAFLETWTVCFCLCRAD